MKKKKTENSKVVQQQKKLKRAEQMGKLFEHTVTSLVLDGIKRQRLLPPQIMNALNEKSRNHKDSIKNLTAFQAEMAGIPMNPTKQ